MNKFNVGDKVRFTDDKDKRIFTVGFLYGDDTLELVENDTVIFSAKVFTLVSKCPYHEGGRIKLAAVFWNKEKEVFQVDETVGTVEGGSIEFDERTYDHFSVPIYRLNTVYTSEASGADYDCAFCEPGEDNIRKAKLEYMRKLNREVDEAKEEYEYLSSQLLSMRQQVGDEHG